MQTQLYKRATFVTHLPMEHLYTPSHNWLARIPESGDLWQVGYTKFALRMLGEIVEVQIEGKEGDPIQPGDIVGSIEGFKAISDVYAVGTGNFVIGNAVLQSRIECLSVDPYRAGWIYQFRGTPDARALDLAGYRNLLDATIDRMLQKEAQSNTHHE